VVRGEGQGADILLVAVLRLDAVDAERVGELRERLCDERTRGRDDTCSRLQQIDRLTLVGTWRPFRMTKRLLARSDRTPSPRSPVEEQ
jgi:hypothetical protein